MSGTLNETIMSDARAEAILHRTKHRGDLYPRAFGVLLAIVACDEQVFRRVVKHLESGHLTDDLEHEAVRRFVLRRIQADHAEVTAKYPELCKVFGGVA